MPQPLSRLRVSYEKTNQPFFKASITEGREQLGDLIGVVIFIEERVPKIMDATVSAG